ncbi:MAG: glycoside hydrolase family 55 protein [Phycisphaerae bacterium]|nr:glycoside hydrolase family 55 protein [Phycisphaerae bacterium]
MRGYTTLSITVAAIVVCLTWQLTSASEDEFVGPFASWLDLKRDYRALGDGKADDTMALQQALDELTKHKNACVLYIPAGTYRLTTTVQTTRQAHTDCQGVTIVGQDPSNTILLWDGPADGTMFRWDAWYSKISRMTFEGKGQAGTGLRYGPAFSTYNETSDLVFHNMKNGLVFGGDKTNGQAENEVLRCRFVNCGTGVQTVNWNSMDIWVWYSQFEDCGRGIFNVMGNWHAWHNLFLRSRIADVGISNLMAFSVVNNTSVESRCFLDFETGHTWGSPTSITGNRVLDPTGDFAMKLSNAGPYLVVDNVFRCQDRTRAEHVLYEQENAGRGHAHCLKGHRAGPARGDCQAQGRRQGSPLRRRCRRFRAEHRRLLSAKSRACKDDGGRQRARRVWSGVRPRRRENETQDCEISIMPVDVFNGRRH